MAWAGGAGTRHKFCGQLGHPSDDETGLLYMRARHYDQVLGRFVSEDPTRDGRNWYVYAGDAPTVAADSDGRVSLLASAAVGAALGTGFNTVSQWLLYGEIDTDRVLTAAVGGAVGGAVGWGITEAFGGGSLSLGQKLLRWLAGGSSRIATTASANYIGGVGADLRHLNGPLGQVLAAHVGRNIALDYAVRFLEEGVQGWL